MAGWSHISFLPKCLEISLILTSQLGHNLASCVPCIIEKNNNKNLPSDVIDFWNVEMFCSVGHLLEGLQQFSECQLLLPQHSNPDNRPGICFKQGGKPSSVYGLQIHTALPVCQYTHMKTNTHHSTMMTSVHGLKWSRFSYQTLHLSSKSFTLFYNDINDTIFRRSRQKLAVKLR